MALRLPFLVEIEIWLMLVFEERGIPEPIEKKSLRPRERTKNIFNPHMCRQCQDYLGDYFREMFKQKRLIFLQVNVSKKKQNNSLVYSIDP